MVPLPNTSARGVIASPPRTTAGNGATIPDLAGDHGHGHSRIKALRSPAFRVLCPVIVSGRVNLTMPSSVPIATSYDEKYEPGAGLVLEAV